VHLSPFSDIVKTHRDSVALANNRMRERIGALRGGAGVTSPLAERIAAFEQYRARMKEMRPVKPLFAERVAA
jgi:hypothetical protein